MEREQNQQHTSRIVFLALSVALGLALSYVEALIPIPLGVPGAKPGLPNIVTVTLLYALGPAEAALVSLMRIVLSGFMFGNLFAILYSMAGFICSFLTMLALKKSGRFGMTGVSTAGGVMHNAGQLAVAALLTDGSVFAYLPVLVIAGTLAGIVVGVAGAIISRRITALIRRFRL